MSWQLNALALRDRHRLMLRAPDDSEGIPFTVIKGDAAKPAVLVMAGVHGDEYEGPVAVQDLAAEIDPKAVRGSIIFVPVANPAAFRAGTRRHPADNGDLNRSFPGDPAGTATERLAHVLFQEFALAAECILSLHGWSKEAAVVPYAEYPDGETEAARKSRAAAHTLGFRYVHPYQWPAGVLGDATLRHGIPTVETEVGGMGTVTPEGQALYRDVVLRFLDYFQVLPFGAATAPEPEIIDHSHVLSQREGLFRSCVSVGETVSAGQQLGVVRSLSGECVQSVHAPRAGVVGILRMLASVQPDNLLAQIFWKREGM